MGYGSAGRRGRVAVLAATVALGAAAPADAATSRHPAGGSDFAADAQGWVGSNASCSVAVGLLCSASTPHEPAAGNPAGSISTRVNVTLNLVGAFQWSGSWTSPSFTVPAGQPVTGATFEYDRQLDPGGLVDLAPQSTVTVTLLDLTAGSSATLLTEVLGPANAAFAKRSVGTPAGAVAAGHSYQLRIATTTTSTVVEAGILGEANTRFDNVALAVDQSEDGGGGGGGGAGGGTPTVSPGVTVVRGPLSNTEMNALFGRFNENTEVGRGPGGSLVPTSACTIVGTPRADRIRGTTGNDVICGLGGNDRVAGGGGIDLVDGARGNDRLSGGRAKDKLIALGGNDRVVGNTGNDRIGGGAGRDRVSGSAGADRLGGGKGRDRISGGSGKDRVRARDRTRDRVNGGKGRDRARVDRVDRVRRVERVP